MSRSKSDSSRKLRCEQLETRTMLSVNAATPELPQFSEPELAQAVVADAVDNSLAARDQALAISAIHFVIDGREVTLTSLDQLLEMEVGSSLQVVGIEYRLNGEEVVEGKIAFEGYLNKLSGSRVKTDYSDGRFGGHEQEGQLAFGNSSHSGLSEAWKMEAGTESLTLVMVRYSADGVAVEDRINVRTQVGTPDFVMYSKVVARGSSRGVVAGEKVQLYGAWGNVGDGTYRNYMEVDIYHGSDPSKIVWSGAISSVTTAGDYDSGEFLNKVKRDGFSKRWIPELGGNYTLKFYVDPENTWNEADESNNVGTATLEVQDLRQVSRGNSASFGRGANHHSVEDAPSRELLAAVSDWNTRAEAVSQAKSSSVGENQFKTQDLALEVAFNQPVNHPVLAPKAAEDRITSSEVASEAVDVDAIDEALTMPEL